MSDPTLPTVQLADEAYEAVRAINHATISRPSMPGPEVYSVLGSLKLLGPGLDQALSQLAGGLGRSLDTHDVYEDDGADPLVRVTEAVDLLTEARQHAAALGRLLERAQSAVARQGYRSAEVNEDDEDDETRDLEDDPTDPLACMRCRVGAPLPHHRLDPACTEYAGPDPS